MFKSTIKQIELPYGFRANSEVQEDGSVHFQFSHPVGLPIRKSQLSNSFPRIEDRVLVAAAEALFQETLPHYM